MCITVARWSVKKLRLVIIISLMMVPEAYRKQASFKQYINNVKCNKEAVIIEAVLSKGNTRFAERDQSQPAVFGCC